MTVPILIPARGGSRRVPKKNIRDLCGKPLLAWSIEAAIKADVGTVYVSTDDDQIACVAHDFGARAHRRPAELATDDARTSDVAAHFMERMRVGRMLLLQATTPMREVGTIRYCAQLVQAGMAVRTVTEERNFWRVTRGNAHPQSRGWLQVPTAFGGQDKRDFEGVVDMPDMYEEPAIVQVQPHEALDIDTEDDFALAEFWMKRKGWA